MQGMDLTSATGHSLSTIAIVGTILGWFPAIAAVAAFVWYCIQIWQSKTVQDYLKKRRRRLLHRLRDRIKELEHHEEEG